VGGGERPRLLKAEAAIDAHSWPTQNAGHHRVPRPRGCRAPRAASGTHGAMKATTYSDRVIIKKADHPAALTSMRGRGVGTELLHAAGAPDRILPRRGRRGGVD
jgi:hypothetical protein